MALTDYSSPYDGADVDSAIALALTAIKPVADYTALRALTPTDGDTAYVAKAGVSGFFIYDAAQVATDDGGIIIQGWVRQDDGILYLDWWLEGVDTSTFDCSTARDTAFDAAIASGKKLVIGPKTYRVTTGYDTTANYQKLFVEGGALDNLGVFSTSAFLLDSADVNSYFLKKAHLGSIKFENVAFRCEQYVLDRKFFWFDGGGARHEFISIRFENVEKPIVYDTNCYFQNSVFRDVQFRDSGTFHSTGNSLRGTLLILDNVNHEVTVPINSEKVVCDLRGVRWITATNFLLEGALPEAGTWTILKLDSGASWERQPSATFINYWSEFSEPLYTVDQSSGAAHFMSPRGISASATQKYKLSNAAMVIIEGMSQAGASINYTDAWEIEDYRCKVIIRDCALRTGLDALIHPQFTLDNVATLGSGLTEQYNSTRVSNDTADLIYRWDGGYIDGESAIATGLYYPSADTTYGRKLVISPENDTILNVSVYAPIKATIGMSNQIVIVLNCKLLTWTGGLVQIRYRVDGVDIGNTTYDSSYSEQIVQIVRPFVLESAPASHVGLVFAAASGTGISGTIEVYSLAYYLGNSVPGILYPRYPKNIQTYNASAPTAGAWAQGDIVWNNAPSAAGTAGWICTAAGTPGTWNTFATIAS